MNESTGLPLLHHWPTSVTRWFPCWLVVIALGVYSQTAFMDFTYDDYPVILEDSRITEFDFGSLLFRDGKFFLGRQVRTVTYMVDYALFGFSPMAFHLHNLFWFSLGVVLVYFFFRRITQNPTVSFVGSLIFALLPINVETVASVTNRKDLLALSFLLFGFLSYFQVLKSTGSKKWTWLGMVGITWVLSFFSKPVTIVFPLLLITYEWLLVPREQRFLTKNVFILFLLAGIGTIVVSLYAFFILDIFNFKTSSILSFTLKGYEGELTYLALVATSARTFWTYFQLVLVPIGLCPDHVVDLSPNFLEIRALVSWIALLSFLLSIFWISSSWPILAFGMVWFAITFLPVSNLAPISYALADRYMYIPSVGICLILTILVKELYERLRTTHRRVALPLSGALLTVLVFGYGGTTLAYLPNWRDGDSIFRFMMQCNPKSGRAHLGLGEVFFQRGMFTKAHHHFTQSIALGVLDGYNSRGATFEEMGKYEAALKDYNFVISQKPKWAIPL